MTKVTQTTGQPHLSAIVQAQCFPLFGHTVWMPDETDTKKILTDAPSGDHWGTLILHGWRLSSKTRNPKTSLWKKQSVAQNRPLWRLMSTFGTTHSQWRMPQKEEHQGPSTATLNFRVNNFSYTVPPEVDMLDQLAENIILLTLFLRYSDWIAKNVNFLTQLTINAPVGIL